MNAKATARISCFAAALLVSFCAVALAEEKSDDKKTDTTTKTTPAPKPEPDPATVEPLTKKQRIEKALREAAEERQRRREAWEANEKRRREAIKRVRDENAARKKQRDAEADPKAPPPLPEDQLSTVTMKNGVSFRGIVIGETPTEVTVKIEGGEMTIDKTLIEAINRPAAPVAPDKK